MAGAVVVDDVAEGGGVFAQPVLLHYPFDNLPFVGIERNVLSYDVAFFHSVHFQVLGQIIASCATFVNHNCYLVNYNFRKGIRSKFYE